MNIISYLAMLMFKTIFQFHLINEFNKFIFAVNVRYSYIQYLGHHLNQVPLAVHPYHPVQADQLCHPPL